jgi:hypothetical protein
MGSWEWSVAKRVSPARTKCCASLAATGNSPVRHAGGFLASVVREATAQLVASARRALIIDGQPYQITYGMQRPDGKLREVYEQAQAVRDAAGKIVRVEGITQDISERIEAQQRIEHLSMHDGLTGLANRQLLAQLVAAGRTRTCPPQPRELRDRASRSSTTSRASTTRLATPPATRCCARSPSDCARRCAGPICWP